MNISLISGYNDHGVAECMIEGYLRMLDAVAMKNILFFIFLNLLDMHFQQTEFAMSKKTIKKWQIITITSTVIVILGTIPRYLRRCSFYIVVPIAPFLVLETFWVIMHVVGMFLCLKWYIQRINEVTIYIA